MIPVKLSVHNFMCYRDVPPLHFDGMHTACISGDNGHGKSALIDAMTWALWGEARGKSDDDLIYQGQSEMAVEFDFTIGEQGFRVIRRRQKPKGRGAGRSALELQIATGNGFRPLSGASIAETQQKIINTLHMNHDIFTNTAYLKQGHSDEFTKKRPGERKEVLASILQLSRYDELAEQAKNLSKQQEMDIKQLEMAISEIDSELKLKPTYQAMLAQAQDELARINELVKSQESRVNQLRQQVEALRGKQEQLHQLEEHISATRRDLEQWEKLAQEHRSRIKDYEGLIAQRQDIEKGYEQYIEVRKLCDDLARKARQSAEFNQRKHSLEMAIEKRQQEQIRQYELTRSKITELEANSQKLPQLKDELQKVELQLSQLSEQEAALNRRKQERQELHIGIKQLETTIQRLKNEISGIQEKMKLLGTREETKCPLCETELGPDGFRLIETKYTADCDSRAESLKSAQAELPVKRNHLQALESEISKKEKEISQSRALAQSKQGALSRGIEDAENALGQVNEAREVLAEIEQRLASKDFIAGEIQALSEVEKQLVELCYDPKHHDTASQQLADLQRFESPKGKLEEALRLIEQERKSAAGAEESARQRRETLDKAIQIRQSLSAELNALPQLANALNKAEIEYRTSLNGQKQAQETLGNVKAKLEYCASLEAKRTEKEKQMGLKAHEKDIYKELAEAFGKSGIQAMLIETAIPEIEAEADKLLSRMTDNRMHVKIESQKQTKAGETRETLDINISDELGTRNYEMFSGGEAFRIDFTIRVALAKLLARRAGAPLRTLIIDEGFGTQDSTGIEKIKEAINSIQDDFDKILVITHIEELRDAFPTRINVKKTAEGSTIELS